MNKNNIKSFVSLNDPILAKVAEEVRVSDITSSKIQKIIENMLKIGYGEQIDKNKPILAGLAAPQIGIPKRIILVDTALFGREGINGLKVYINPEIIWKSNDENEWYEGCFSAGQVRGIVSRSNKIKIKAYTREGKPIYEQHEGFIARVFQHEIDHLNGIVFVSHITDDDKIHWVEDEEMQEYSENENWRNWPKKCSRKKWERMTNKK